MQQTTSKFKAVFKREIKIFSGRYLYIFVVIVLPLFSLIYTATIFGDGQIENIPIGIVDNTNSHLTREIVRNVAAVPTFNVSPQHYYLNEQQAREATQKMEIYGYLVIPQNFDTKLYNGLNPTLTYYYHYAILSIGGEVNGAFLTVLSNVSAKILGETGQKAGLSAQQITALVLPTSARSFPIYNPDLDFSIFISYPFFFIFLQIIILVFVVYSIGMEIKTGSVTELLKCAGNNIFIAIIGKLSPYAIIFILESIFANYVFLEIVKIPFECSPIPLILDGILLIIATMSIGVVLILAIPQLPIAISFASMFGALGATTCGVTFPVESMYKIFELMCYLFPARYFAHINHNLLYDNVGFAYTWPYFVALIAFIIPALLILPRLNKINAHKPIPIPSYYGIILIILGGTIGYGLLYNFIYQPNIVEKVPIAIVDNSKSELSNKYSQYLNATQGISVITNAINFEKAKKLMESHKIRGIIFLPHNFSNRINNGEESVFLMYETTTSFLYYLTIQSSAIAAMQKINNEYRANIVKKLPKQAQLELSLAPNISISGIPLYNNNGGYGSFLLPIVFIIVIFQTLLMAIGVFCGTRNEEQNKSGNKYITNYFTRTYKNPFLTILHISAPFIITYFALSFFLLGLLPGIFNLPNIGNPLVISPFILLFIITTAVAGISFSRLFSDSESAILMIPFFSIGLIFLGGMSFPLEQIPLFWRFFYYLFPSSPAVTGYIKLTTMGANIQAIAPQIITLLIQLAIYITIAATVLRKKP
ncbi:MAG: ABC transporter permease [Bacteroidales bacterium]